MIKSAIITTLAALTLAACGGGGGDAAQTTPTAKAFTLSYYGSPLSNSAQATAHAAVIRDASGTVAASDPGATTVQTLQDALAAQGVTATITPQVMDGTALHALIMGEDNGLPPTNDQFKTDPSGYLVANFQLDDMATASNDPTQNAALQQFQQDLTTFIQRAHVAGKLVLVVLPIPTCDATPNHATEGGYNAADALSVVIMQASGDAGGFPIGGLQSNLVDPSGNVTNDFTAGHLGADCRTPDAYLLNAHVTSIATDIASRYKAESSTATTDTTASAPVAASQ